MSASNEVLIMLIRMATAFHTAAMADTPEPGHTITCTHQQFEKVAQYVCSSDRPSQITYYTVILPVEGTPTNQELVHPAVGAFAVKVWAVASTKSAKVKDQTCNSSFDEKLKIKELQCKFKKHRMGFLVLQKDKPQ